jgi:hypothetical protein
MPPKRSKKQCKAADSRQVASENLETLRLSEEEDVCHNWMSLACSSIVEHAAAAAWYWRSMPQQELEGALQHLHQDSQKEIETVYQKTIRAFINTVKCSNCTKQMVILLKRQPIRGLVVPASVAALEQMQHRVQASLRSRAGNVCSKAWCAAAVCTSYRLS